MAGNNPTPTVTLQNTIADVLNIAVKERNSHQIVRFDMGQGREVAFVAITDDTNGYLNMLQAYALSRDEYAQRVANAVADDFIKNGPPDPKNPRGINLIKASDGENLSPPDGDDS